MDALVKLQQAEYKREGIEWREVTWRDNQPTLELIEGRPKGLPGLLIALDDATWRAAASALVELSASPSRGEEGGAGWGGGEVARAPRSYSRRGEGPPGARAAAPPRAPAWRARGVRRWEKCKFLQV